MQIDENPIKSLHRVNNQNNIKMEKQTSYGEAHKTKNKLKNQVNGNQQMPAIFPAENDPFNYKKDQQNVQSIAEIGVHHIDQKSEVELEIADSDDVDQDGQIQKDDNKMEVRGIDTTEEFFRPEFAQNT